MKQFLMGASLCLAVVAISKINSNNHYASGGHALALQQDTTPSKDSTKPKTQLVAFNILQDTTPKDTNKPKMQLLMAYANDTTPSKDTVKPKAGISYAALYRSDLTNDTTPSKDTSKPKTIVLVASLYNRALAMDTTPTKVDTSSKPKTETLIAWASR